MRVCAEAGLCCEKSLSWTKQILAVGVCVVNVCTGTFGSETSGNLDTN